MTALMSELKARLDYPAGFFISSTFSEEQVAVEEISQG
jgi:hypothetical protein